MRRQDILVCLFSPLAAAALLLGVFWRFELYPFGSNTLAWCDMRQQVVPLWMQLRDALAGETGLWYSFRTAGGMNLWGVLMFFVSSPLSLLTLLWEKSELLLAANVLTLLKLVLCSISAAWYFCRRHPGLSPCCKAALAVGYALGGYSMMYYQNSVWLEVMLLFPPLLLSAEGLEQRGGIGYCLLLTASICTNFYLAFPLLLFLVLAAAVYCLVRLSPAQRGPFALRLGGYTALALLLSAPVWLPSLLSVLTSARTGGVLEALRAGGLFTRVETTLSLLWCSAAALGLLPFAFALRRDRRVRADGILLLLMLVPMILEPVNKMWHTGSYQAFPVRYGFIPILLLLSLAAAVLEHRLSAAETASSPAAAGVTAAAAAAAGGTLAALLALRFEELTAYTRKLWVTPEAFVPLSIAAAALAGAAWTAALFARRGGSRRLICGAFAALTAFGGVFSTAVYIGGAAQSARWFEPAADLEGRVDDDGFYRVKTARKLFDVNLIGALGYNNLGHYTSLTREDYLLGVRQLGYSGYWMETGSHGGSIITDALLQNRYTIAAHEQPDFMPEVYRNRSYRILESGWRLPFGIVTAAGAETLSQQLPQERIRRGERMLQLLLGNGRPLVSEYSPAETAGVSVTSDGQTAVLLSAPGRSGLLRYRIAVREPTILYLDCFHQASTRLAEAVNGALTVLVNGEQRAASYPSQRENGLLELGLFENGEVVVELTVNKPFTARSFGVFGVDAGGLSDMTANAAGAALSAGARSIRGSAAADSAGSLLFLPIPYDEGWRAAVNGRAAEPLRVFGCWTALPLEQGENTVEMSFIPRGMTPALLLSALGLAGGLAARRIRWPQTLPASLRRCAYRLLLLCASAAFMLLYLFPMAAYLTR